MIVYFSISFAGCRGILLYKMHMTRGTVPMLWQRKKCFTPHLHLRNSRVDGLVIAKLSKMQYDERYTKYIRKIGLLPFVQIVSRGMPKMKPCALTALVDRWRPETHTFH